MRPIIKILTMLLGCFCLCTTAISAQHQGPTPMCPIPSAADKAMMNTMASQMMHFKVSMMGRRMMVMGVKIYTLGKMMSMKNNKNMPPRRMSANNMKMDPQQMMMIGMQMYQNGKMIAGRSMTPNDLKKMMMRWRSCHK